MSTTAPRSGVVVARLDRGTGVLDDVRPQDGTAYFTIQGRTATRRR